MDSVDKELSFSSNEEFMKASFIDLTDIELWKKAKGSPRQWPKERRINWQQAVENRVLYLYKELSIQLKFGEWFKKKK